MLFILLKFPHLKQIELRIPSDSDSLEDDHGASDEGEVVGDEEGVGVEDLVQVEADRHELLPPALDRPEGQPALDLVSDRQLGRVKHLLQHRGQRGLWRKSVIQMLT